MDLCPLKFLIGSVLGLVVSRLSMPNNQKQKDLKELDKTRYQLISKNKT